MHRRRVLAGAATCVSAGLLGGCATGEGKDEHRVAVNGSASGGSSATSGDDPHDRGLVLLREGFYRNPDASGIRGAVTNRGDVDLDYIAAYARFLDASGSRLEQDSDNRDGLAVGDTWQFDVELLHTDPSAVARYRLVVLDQRTSEVPHPFGKRP